MGKNKHAGYEILQVKPETNLEISEQEQFDSKSKDIALY